MADVQQSAARQGFALKAIVVAILTVLLLIPLAMINGTISERKNYRQQAVQSVAESFAGEQVISGPVIVLPYVETSQISEIDGFGKRVSRLHRSQRRWLFFPARLRMHGTLLPSVRKRGLHEVRVYELQSLVDARFDLLLPTDPGGLRELGQPYLSLSISDVRGLAGTPSLRADGQALQIEQGPGAQRGGSGLHALLAPVHSGQRLRLAVELRSSLAGTESLSIAPIADSNEITLQSSWPHPQFAGRFLPRSHHIGGKGFRARWDISSLAAGTQGQTQQGIAAARLDALKVSLVEPVNIYTQADRASKYGVLFVLLTFVSFFLFELLKRLPIHPIQYALVGLALAIFFLLLLSLSEHLPFWIAYLAASASCIGLQGVYLSSVLRSRVRGAAFAAGLTLLYAALYGLLVSEDNALVLGALMLFAILAALMMVTRNVDWYAPSRKEPTR